MAIKNSWCISTLKFGATITWFIEWSYSSFSLTDINVYHSMKTNYFVFGFFKRGNGWPPIFWIRSSRRPNCSPMVGNFAPIEAGGRGFFVINNFPTKERFLLQLFNQRARRPCNSMLQRRYLYKFWVLSCASQVVAIHRFPTPALWIEFLHWIRHVQTDVHAVLFVYITPIPKPTSGSIVCWR